MAEQELDSATKWARLQRYDVRARVRAEGAATLNKIKAKEYTEKLVGKGGTQNIPDKKKKEKPGKTIKCCICGKQIKPVGTWTQGNNAQPVKDGRCCDYCNSTVVIPARINMIGRR